MPWGRAAEQRGGAGPYEAWATALKLWSEDPHHPMDGLPRLDDATFDPETYQRLIERIRLAITAFMDRWGAELTAGLGRAETAHDYARELVQLREKLRPRIQLAQHPAWPPALRDALVTGLDTDVRNIQKELETAVKRVTDRGRMAGAERDRLMLILRQNSFVALLGGRDVAQHEWHPPAPDAVAAQVSADRPIRRILPLGDPVSHPE